MADATIVIVTRTARTADIDGGYTDYPLSLAINSLAPVVDTLSAPGLASLDEQIKFTEDVYEFKGLFVAESDTHDVTVTVYDQPFPL